MVFFIDTTPCDTDPCRALAPVGQPAGFSAVAWSYSGIRSRNPSKTGAGEQTTGPNGADNFGRSR
eukprot:8096654-Prorocentrum_lima.AAC.1